MSQTKNFNLPDLGEGLPDATIVEWFVKEGDVIKLDEPLVSMETAKAVVEVPSPVSGKVLKLAGAAGDIVVTGHVLAQFEIDPNLHTEVEVRFVADGAFTRIELEHRYLERAGATAQMMRDAIDSPGGWGGLLERYAATAGAA